jgi:tetratricopeptide (TPR) repeat protein
MRRLAAIAVVCGCSAPATLSELSTAERRADNGDTDGAIAAYHEAQVKCGDLRPARRAKAACADSWLGEAEVLEHAGRTAAATEAYLAIPGHLPDDAATSAIAMQRAGEMQLRAGQIVPAWTSLWRVVTDWPDEGPASDALRVLLRDGRARDPRALADQMAKALTALAETGVADNLVWSLADLTEHELGNPASARALYDRIPVDYPKSGLRDDARWNAARISRKIGDPQGAVQRLKGLLATREVAFGPGSYFSIWLDDAQLELGRVLRDDLHDLPGAIRAFEKLPKNYPASIELAVTQRAAGNQAKACEAFAKLVKDSPDSKYARRKAEVGCD